jgi:hypothetical protein
MPTRDDHAGPAVRGEVVYLYAFDVANEARLDGVQGLLGSRPVPFDVRPDRTVPRYVPLSHPLTVEPTLPAARVDGLPVRLRVRVFAVGVVSVSLRAAVTAGAPADLVPFHNPKLDDGRPLDVLAREVCAATCRELGDRLVRPSVISEPEAYTIFLLTDLGGELDANRWLAGRRREVAGLLAETRPDRLSEAQADEILRLRRSFENSDLVVIDWDAALVVDLDGYAEDVLFVVELANLQLEEFQWMDRVLDGYLDRAYEDMPRRRRRAFGAAAGVLGSLRQLRLDLARLADEVAHATKFVGDWHLARVYALARERFHLDQWRASVGERLGQLDDLYTLARGELYERRMFWLEVAIVLLFVGDLVLLVWRP